MGYMFYRRNKETNAMEEKQQKQFLPISKEDMLARGWDECDFIIVTADAYIDHHSFGTAIISRVLENAGYKVGIIAQPDWKTTDDFMKLGKPRLAFLSLIHISEPTRPY